MNAVTPAEDADWLVLSAVHAETGLPGPPAPLIYAPERFPVWHFLIRYRSISASFREAADTASRREDLRRALEVLFAQRPELFANAG
ncbi:MAG: hypothetical protein KDG50_03675 [Chromatiales bacterium]|nr:hypothetical protein [Chromatiales bacterium]